jgi:hypothetical protein
VCLLQIQVCRLPVAKVQVVSVAAYIVPLLKKRFISRLNLATEVLVTGCASRTQLCAHQILIVNEVCKHLRCSVCYKSPRDMRSRSCSA